MTERYITITNIGMIGIIDTKENNKTIDDFLKDLEQEYRDNGAGYNVFIAKEIAQDEYMKYLHENIMTPHQIVNELNNYEKVTQALEEKTNDLYIKALENVRDLNILEIAIEKVQKDYDNVPIVQEAIEKIIMTKRELK